MALTKVDYTTFTKVDPNSHLAIVGTNHLDFDAYQNEDCCLYKDCDVDYFGDFEHKVDVRTLTSPINQFGILWQLSNEKDDFNGLYETGKTVIAIAFRYSACHITLMEANNNDFYQDEYVLSSNNWCYLTIIKSGTLLKCNIYSDSARTNLLDTLSLTLHTNHKFRYLFAANTFNSGESNYCTLDIENLSIEPPLCTCTAWVNAECTEPGKRHQTRICTPVGCDIEDQIIDDPTCVPSEGTLSVTTSPTGASVKVDTETKTSPCSFSLPQGIYTVTITKAGYDTITDSVGITSGQTTTKSYTLTMTIACDGPTPHFATGCKLLLHYDVDNDGLINLDELNQSYYDYENGIITEDELDFVFDAYIYGGINVICPGCWIAPPKKIVTFESTPAGAIVIVDG